MKKPKFRIVLKKDWYYYVQERFLFFFWIDMRPYYDDCISFYKGICEDWIENIKKGRKKNSKKTEVVWYYD